MQWAKNFRHKRPQNANIVETSEEEETDSEYEVKDVKFCFNDNTKPNRRFC